jgi:hypothetical protein
LDELDALMRTWGFAYRTEAIDVAIRFLGVQSDTTKTLELP